MKALRDKCKRDGLKFIKAGGYKESDGSNYNTGIMLAERKDGSFITWEAQIIKKDIVHLSYGKYFKNFAEAEKDFTERVKRNG